MGRNAFGLKIVTVSLRINACSSSLLPHSSLSFSFHLSFFVCRSLCHLLSLPQSFCSLSLSLCLYLFPSCCPPRRRAVMGSGVESVSIPPSFHFRTAASFSADCHHPALVEIYFPPLSCTPWVSHRRRGVALPFFFPPFFAVLTSNPYETPINQCHPPF